MTWQRRARMAAAVVGLSCAAAVYFLARERPSAAPPPTPPQLSDRNATSESSHGTFDRSRAGKSVYRLEFEHSALYPDGHSRSENVHLVTSRGGRQFDIRANVAVEKGKAVTGDAPGQVTLTGHVLMDTGDGLHVETEAATYDDAAGLVTIPGRLTFARGRLSGESLGATYDRQKDVLWLAAQPHVQMAPDKTGGGVIDADASSMEMARTAKYIRLLDHARIVRDRETLAADLAVVHLTSDEQGVELVELRGHSSVIPRAGTTGGAPDMRASDITLAFHPDGRTLKRSTLAGRAALIMANDAGQRTVTASWIDVVLAPNGQTMTGLEAREGVVVKLPRTADTPSRTITAATLVAQGDDRGGLKSALFDGGIQFTETQSAASRRPAVSRTGTSKALALVLGGQLDAIDEAEFRQNVIFKDADVLAAADRAVYFATKGQLRLSSADGTHHSPNVSQGTAENGTFRIDGRLITLNTDNHDLDAAGNVITTTVGARSPTSAKSQPALFDRDKPISGSAPEVHYSSEAHRAKYVGGPDAIAVVWQDESAVKADEIVVEEGSGNLSASGHVQSTFLLEKPPRSDQAAKDTPAKPAEYALSANTMVYTDADRRASYVGDPDHPAVLHGPDGTVNAQRIDLLLAKEQRSLELMIAVTSVYAELEGKRRAAGDHLTYDARTDQYVLRGAKGASARIIAPEARDNPTACTLQKAQLLTFARTGGLTADSERAPVPMTRVACDTSIKSIK